MAKESHLKASLQDLAVRGGQPLFREPRHVGRPGVGDRGRLFERIGAALDRRWLSNRGPLVEEFERAIERHIGVKHCIAVANATLGLEIAARALGMAGEVVVPSFTFVALPHALQWQGITPVFADVDARTHCLDPEQVERAITPRTTGIAAVHLWGRPCAVEELAWLARRRGLALLFDAAHAFGCAHRGTMIGNFGQAEVFSFHATKILNSFEGGAVVTNDVQLAAKIRAMQNFGLAAPDCGLMLGINGKMSEVSAAMGLTGLESLEEFIALRRRNYHSYRAALSGIPGVRLMEYDETEKCNYQYVVVTVEPEESGIGRDRLLEVLHAENIRARRYFHPGCHRMEPYRSLFPQAGARLEQTERLAQRVLVLPSSELTGEAEIGAICRILALAVAHAAELEPAAPALLALQNGDTLPVGLAREGHS